MGSFLVCFTLHRDPDADRVSTVTESETGGENARETRPRETESEKKENIMSNIHTDTLTENRRSDRSVQYGPFNSV